MIFGTRIPKFIDQSGNTVSLEYAKILEDAPSYRMVEQESVINNYINNIHLGVHWVFKVRIHLYKHGASAAITAYNNLIQYLGTDVYLYPHSEGNTYKDSSGNDVLFRVQEVTPAYFETPDFKDIILMSFKSTKLVDLSELTLPNNTIFTRKQDMIFPMTDSDGNIQTYDLTEDAE